MIGDVCGRGVEGKVLIIINILLALVEEHGSLLKILVQE